MSQLYESEKTFKLLCSRNRQIIEEKNSVLNIKNKIIA